MVPLLLSRRNPSTDYNWSEFCRSNTPSKMKALRANSPAKEASSHSRRAALGIILIPTLGLMKVEMRQRQLWWSKGWCGWWAEAGGWWCRGRSRGGRICSPSSPFLLSINLVSEMLSYQPTNDSIQEVGAARNACREHHVLGCLREARRVCCE